MKAIRIISLIVTILLLMCAMSCTGSWHLRRAIKKSPELFTNDTTIVRDTLIVENLITQFKQAKDSIVYITKFDTVTRDSIRIKYKWNTYTDSVYIEADCPDLPTETQYVNRYIILKSSFKERLIDAFKILIGFGLVFIFHKYMIKR